MYSTIDPSYLVSSMKAKSSTIMTGFGSKCVISLSPSSANNLSTSLSGDRRLLSKANALPLYTEGNPAAFVPSSTSFATKNCCTQFRYVELSLSAETQECLYISLPFQGQSHLHHERGVFHTHKWQRSEFQLGHNINNSTWAEHTWLQLCMLRAPCIASSERYVQHMH